VSSAPKPRHEGIRYYPNVIQGSEEWHAMRCGMLTASEMCLIVTPTLKAASNEKERMHLYELLAQRISGYVEPSYIGDNMLRGWADEERAKSAYAKTYAAVQDVGFITNDKFGFKIGYSPDALVGDDGLIEAKSKRQKLHVQAIVEAVAKDTIPVEHMIQVQTGLLVSERKWCDFISYSGGLPMATVRVFPDPEYQEAILTAAAAFEERLAEKLALYRRTVGDHERRFIPTERVIEQEMFV
jgi:hypothetical protein